MTDFQLAALLAGIMAHAYFVTNEVAALLACAVLAILALVALASNR